MRIDDVSRTKSVGKQNVVEAEKPKAPLQTNNQKVFTTKAFEKNFAASLTKLNLFGFGREDDPKPQPQNPNLSTSGSGTDTSYRIGSPTRPNIKHDNGFLQNPNNPNDPNPIAPPVKPSEKDIEFYESEKNKVKWAQRIDNFNIPFRDEDDTARRLEDGIEAYRHFLEGNGADRTFSYDEFIREDKSGQKVLESAIADTQRGAEDLYNQMVARDPSLAGKPITFDVTSGVITVGASTKYPYPDTENWQKAVGGHAIWNSATVTVTPPAKPGDKPQFSMKYTLHAEDRYNFNPGQHDIATGAPDATRGKLEQTGLAHQYNQYATAQRDVTWNQGDISNSTNVKSSSGR